jgi:hypothetical protein
MDVAQFKAWVKSLPPGEANIPYANVAGDFLTPNQMLQAAENNPTLLKNIQAVMGDPMQCPSCGYMTNDMSVRTCPQCRTRMQAVSAVNIDDELAKERFKQRVKEGRVLPVVKMGRLKSPEEQLREVEDPNSTAGR